MRRTLPARRLAGREYNCPVTGYRLIVVPYELGRLRDGVGNGPERLLDAGAEDVLASSGAG